MQLIQQSEATSSLRRLFFHAVDATDGISPEPGLTGAGRLSKAGAATAATTNNITEIDSTNMPGRYYIELTATEVNTLGVVEFRFKAAACAEVIARALVVAFDPFTASNLGITNLDAAISSRSNHSAPDLSNLDTTVSSRLAAASYTTPPTAAAIRAEIDSSSTELATLISRLTAARATLLDNLSNLDAAISSRLAAASYTAPNNAGIAENQTDLDSIIAALLDSSAVQAAANAALVALHLDHLLAVAYDPASKPGAADALLNELVENDAGVSRFTANALEQAPSGGGGGLTLADFFDTDSGETAGTAVSGSVVGEMVAAISGGGVAGSTEVTDITINDGSSPVEGAAVWITTDTAGTNVVWSGTTDASGNPKDAGGNNPFLDPGTYYIWVQLGGYTFSNPTSHTVS